MADSPFVNLREHCRIDAFIPIEYRVLSEGERINIKSFVSSDSALNEFPMPVDHNDPVLNAWLKMLNAKLDASIGMMSKQVVNASGMTKKKVNISGGGLSFDSYEEYKISDRLEIKMILSVTVPSMLCVYGDVVDVRKSEGAFQIAVKFVAIDDNVRDKIVQFVFKTQRDQMRQNI